MRNYSNNIGKSKAPIILQKLTARKHFNVQFCIQYLVELQYIGRKYLTNNCVEGHWQNAVQCVHCTYYYVGNMALTIM